MRCLDVPACPWCRSTLMTVIYAGPVVDALVDVADPDAGVRAVVIEAELHTVEASSLRLSGSPRPQATDKTPAVVPVRQDQ